MTIPRNIATSLTYTAPFVSEVSISTRSLDAALAIRASATLNSMRTEHNHQPIQSPLVPGSKYFPGFVCSGKRRHIQQGNSDSP